MEKKKSTRETKSSLSDAPKKSNKKPKLSKLASPAKAAPPSEGLLLEEVLEMEDKEVADLYLNRYHFVNFDSNLKVVMYVVQTSILLFKTLWSPPNFEKNRFRLSNKNKKFEVWNATLLITRDPPKDHNFIRFHKSL